MGTCTSLAFRARAQPGRRPPGGAWANFCPSPAKDGDRTPPPGNVVQHPTVLRVKKLLLEPSLRFPLSSLALLPHVITLQSRAPSSQQPYGKDAVRCPQNLLLPKEKPLLQQASASPLVSLPWHPQSPPTLASTPWPLLFILAHSLHSSSQKGVKTPQTGLPVATVWHGRFHPHAANTRVHPSPAPCPPPRGVSQVLAAASRSPTANLSSCAP